ncbi:MAG TPA: hypothetical protein VFV66_34555 [Nonomuraea sp.]|nr:hypothetical protein [Nonomuraea sp.]
MPHGDDLDERFDELVSQIEKGERRKMAAEAAKGAKEARRTAREARRAAGKARRERLPAQEPSPRRPRPGRDRIALVTIAAMIAGAGVLVTYRPDLLLTGGPVPEETTPVGSLSEESLPQESLSGEPGPTATAADGSVTTASSGPFEGSEAENWAEGADGFVMPKAKSIGGLPKKDVAKALKRTRELLAAAYLDRGTIMGGKPAAFAELLDPEERSWFRKNLGRKGEKSSRGWVMSLAPKTAELVTDVIKVRGRAKLSAFTKKNLTGARIETNFLIVYGIRRPGQPGTTTRLVAHPRGTVLVYRTQGELVIWVADWGFSVTPARCDVRDAYVHPSYPDSVPDKKGGKGEPTDPYDLDEPPGDGDCGASLPT